MSVTGAPSHRNRRASVIQKAGWWIESTLFRVPEPTNHGTDEHDSGALGALELEVMAIMFSRSTVQEKGQNPARSKCGKNQIAHPTPSVSEKVADAVVDVKSIYPDRAMDASQHSDPNQYQSIYFET
ncbi:MAG: hypothetical protein M1835_007396 [Candelina submexicana]|nr:MAG: hypothetical protein M1835_007396 [Candelina submexicana]